VGRPGRPLGCPAGSCRPWGRV